ncbi:LacI family DNA-binding transcriptional regulator [Porcincola intestinalis]|uniref:LacI family DNA-binding transcriptional regulator n=1 Tax=Porcincola intestinalis TaxID=2606632 RepID=A0A6L5XC19_9FIRM|nr:LacI family DNA-binding transcriptional regulator [Porcincola intestinalis]MSS16032.1 LacI family DNA-binding transcriptional regulator [Porcincola intestinalis]
MATLRDVAKLAGVGAGTVSRFLNESGYVSDDTKLKIQDAMVKLDYTPNELARNLYHHRTGNIAVLVPSVTFPYFARFIECVEGELYERGFKTMICSTAKQQNAEMEYLDMLKRHIVDGVITGVHTLDDDIYRKIHLPIVALDRYLGEEIPVVTSDHKDGGRKAAMVLINSGCHRVMQFRGSQKVKVASPYHERHNEFERVMKEHGILIENYNLAWNHHDSPYYKKIAYEVAPILKDYDGFFAVDEGAAYVMSECERLGMKVPDDIQIVSYDGTFITDLTEPRLTSIVQPVEQIAADAADLIVQRIQGMSFLNKKIVRPVTLKAGGSTISCSTEE